tara:strand:+ start:327 stop:686 length:360 start_codon:yes stop_codon:yes gene_type:complete
MSDAKTIDEYLENMQALLKQAPHFKLVVERQIQHRLLPDMSGVKAELEPALWKLLLFCLNGQSHAVELTPQAREQAHESVGKSENYQQNQAASYPKAAKQTWQILDALHTHGSYPPRKI